MMKHIDDEGDLSLVLNDAGEVLVVCTECGKKWTGKFQEITTVSSGRRMRNFARDLAGSPRFAAALQMDDGPFAER